MNCERWSSSVSVMNAVTQIGKLSNLCLADGGGPLLPVDDPSRLLGVGRVLVDGDDESAGRGVNCRILVHLAVRSARARRTR